MSTISEYGRLFRQSNRFIFIRLFQFLLNYVIMNVIFFICCYFRTQPFEVKPSLYPVVEYLSGESIHMFPIEKCPYCKKQALKEDPEVRNNRNRTLFKKLCLHQK